MKEIITALIKAQKEMGNAKKDANNPFFKSKYADLNSVREAVMPLLNANGIVVLQPICTIDGKNYVKTMLLHESGQSIESFTEILFKSANDPQAQGSGITYARRYGIQSLLCIGADDDDGNAAAKQPQKKEVINKPVHEEKQPLSKVRFETALSKLGNDPLKIVKSLAEYLLTEEQKNEVNNAILDLAMIGTINDQEINTIKTLIP